MEEIFEQFKDKDAFDAYWKEHYVPLTYEDVREAYEDFVKSADKHIFLSDYDQNGQHNQSRQFVQSKYCAHLPENYQITGRLKLTSFSSET